MKEKMMDATTENKIREAARTVFTRKGFAATKLRDIASEADINLSLINYYFRSKEKLFHIIMRETMEKLMGGLSAILNDEGLSFMQKVEKLAGYYIDLLLQNPDLPAFIVHEISSDPERFATESGIKKELMQSHFVQQLLTLNVEHKIGFNPLHIMINLLGMAVFPFIARPLLLVAGASLLDKPGFTALMEARKKLIPLWIAAIIDQ